jgi:hypothetical protein
MKNTKEGDNLAHSSIPQSSTSSADGNANNLDGVPMNMDIDVEGSNKLSIGILGVKTKWDNDEDEDEDNNQNNDIKKDDDSPTSSIKGARITTSDENKDDESNRIKLGDEGDDEVDDIFA